MKKLLCLLAVSLPTSTHAQAVHYWSFEDDQLPPGGVLSAYQTGNEPAYATNTFSQQVWDGGSFSLLQDTNRRSMYFGAAPATAAAPVGPELRSDGDGGRFSQPTVTVEAFVKVDKHVERFALIASKRRRNNGASWSLSITPTGVFSVRLDTQEGASGPGFNRTVSSGTEVNDGLWHHVAMTYDHPTRECALYVDYRLCKTATTAGPLVYDDAQLTIGRGLNGWIDEVRISSTVLHQEQFLRPTRFFTDTQEQKRKRPEVMLDLTPTRVQTSVALDWEKVGTLKPKSVDEIPGGFWSLGCETLDRDLADWDAYKGYLKPLGIKRIRLQGGWAKTEKKKGIHDFEWLDHIVDSAHELGLTVCLETSYGNRLYEPRAGLGPGGVLPEGEETLSAWDAWVEAMVRRYKPKGVNEWMMYNEPNLNRKNTPDRVIAFNSRTASLIKRVDPDAKIAGLVVSGLNLSWIEKWLKGLRDLGTLNHFEWVIYHGYGANPDGLAGGMKKVEALVREYSPGIRLWQGEAGCASEEVQYALSGIDWTEISHAKWNARRMLCDFAHEIESTVFTISDLSYHKNFISRYGLLKTNPDNSLIKVKSAYYVVNNVVSVFNDAVSVNGSLTIAFPPEQALTAYAFKHIASSYDIIALWDGDSIPVHECDLAYAAPSVAGLNIDDPVWVDLLTSRIYQIPPENISRREGTTTFVDIPVFDSPILLTDRSVLSYVKARKTKKRVAKKAREAPAKKSTSLPFKSYRMFGAQKSAPAIIICHPDDARKTWADKVAATLRSEGIHAFILTDRSESIADAVSHVRSQASGWQINPEQIGVCGAPSELTDYTKLGANFAVLIREKTGGKASKDANMKVLDAADTAAQFNEESTWLRSLLKWLEPRKTKVF